jgi:hypothetical protein
MPSRGRLRRAECDANARWIGPVRHAAPPASSKHHAQLDNARARPHATVAEPTVGHTVHAWGGAPLGDMLGSRKLLTTARRLSRLPSSLVASRRREYDSRSVQCEPIAVVFVISTQSAVAQNFLRNLVESFVFASNDPQPAASGLQFVYFHVASSGRSRSCWSLGAVGSGSSGAPLIQ